MNGTSKPSRKIHITKFTLTFRIFIDNELFQVVEIQICFIPEIFKYVFYSYVSIIIRIKGKECFSDRLETITEFGL